VRESPTLIENAAVNILSKGLSITGYLTNTLGRSEINACGEMTLYLNLVSMLKQGRSAKQESPPSTQ
jgi:putative transposase